MKTHPLLIVFLAFASCNDSKVEVSTPPEPESKSSASRSPSTQFPEAQQTEQQLTAETVKTVLQKANVHDLVGQLNEIAVLMEKTPEQADEILSSYVSLLNTKDNEQTVKLLLNTESTHTLRDSIIQAYIKGWQNSDEDGLLAYLNERLDPSLQDSFTSRSILHFLLKPESGLINDPAETLARLDTMEPRVSEAALLTLMRLIDHSDAPVFSQVSEECIKRLKSPSFQHYLPEFTEMVASAQPETLKNIFSEIPHGAQRNASIELAIGELGRHHPEVLQNWLKSPETIRQFFHPKNDEVANQGEYEQEQNRVFDNALQTYIFNTLDQHPEIALNSIDFIIDADRRKDILARVQHVINRQ